MGAEDARHRRFENFALLRILPFSACVVVELKQTSKFSLFGGGGAVSDVAIARFWCFGGDMAETAVTDLVGMV